MADYYINKTAARIDFLLEKVEGIEDGAEVNQNAISSVTANGVTIASGSKTDGIEVAAGSNITVVADASNKILTISADDTTYSDATTSTSGLMSAADKTKINGIESGAEVNVQSDWNQSDSTADDFIKNKPTVYTQSETDTLLSTKADSSSLATVATSGSYSDLDNKPEINGETLQGDKSSTELKIAGKIVDGGTGEVFNDYSNNVASGVASHAEGSSTTASGNYAHAEGIVTTASGTYSHAEGCTTIASGVASHAEGYHTTASSNAQHVQGKYNIKDRTGKYAFIIGNGTADNARSNALAIDWNGDIYPANYGKGVNLAQLDTDVAALRLALDAEVYGFRIDKQDSNPETRVTYMYDAVGKTPARMNYTTGQFNYGSWANAWFITGNKPCALKYDGTVDYYLDENDYTEKEDGTASDVSDSSYAGNFMASMPAVWIKRWEDERYLYYAFSDKQINSSFKAYAHDAGDGFINDMIYLPMFKGVVVDSKLRSIAGVTPQGGTTGSEEKTAAETCGTGWQMWDWSKHELIADLLTLISRSTDSQTAFGQGNNSNYDDTSTTHGVLTTGSDDVQTGQFYGTDSSDRTKHVKVFHIEDFWGNRAERCLGLHLDAMEYKYRLTRPYVLTPDSTYTSSGLTAPGTGYISTQTAGIYGSLPSAADGSYTTYECDSFASNTGQFISIFGGDCQREYQCGSHYLNIRSAPTTTYWGCGSSPCYNASHSS